MMRTFPRSSNYVTPSLCQVTIKMWSYVLKQFMLKNPPDWLNYISIHQNVFGFILKLCDLSVFTGLPNTIKWRMVQITGPWSKPMLLGLMFWSMEM